MTIGEKYLLLEALVLLHPAWHHVVAVLTK